MAEYRDRFSPTLLLWPLLLPCHSVCSFECTDCSGLRSYRYESDVLSCIKYHDTFERSTLYATGRLIPHSGTSVCPLPGIYYFAPVDLREHSVICRPPHKEQYRSVEPMNRRSGVQLLPCVDLFLPTSQVLHRYRGHESCSTVGRALVLSSRSSTVLYS